MNPISNINLSSLWDFADRYLPLTSADSLATAFKEVQKAWEKEQLKLAPPQKEDTLATRLEEAKKSWEKEKQLEYAKKPLKDKVIDLFSSKMAPEKALKIHLEKVKEVWERERQLQLAKESDPLALSAGDIALCASGLFTLAAATTGLPWGTRWLASPLASSFLFYSSAYTTPTTGFGLVTALLMASRFIGEKNPVVPFLGHFINQSGTLAPLQMLVQAVWTTKQAARAFKGIHTCIQQIGKEDTDRVIRNLFVHTINLATTGLNLAASAKIGLAELNYYEAWGLTHLYSKEYAQGAMGDRCPGFFEPKPLPAYNITPLSESSTILEKVGFVWDSNVVGPLYRLYNALYVPLAQC